MVYPFPGAEEKEYMKLLFATYVYSKYKTHKFMPDLSLSSYFSQKSRPRPLLPNEVHGAHILLGHSC